MNAPMLDVAGLSDMREHAQKAAALLKALANENRLMIMCTLISGEMSVGELNEKIPLSQSALSQHLASLREAGLVTTRKEAQTVFYQLSGNEAMRIIAVLQSIYCPSE
ncbi:metalloregulator ArsR/SmtB family transcription factor [Cellvibrio sp. PSBB006]|uniref:ArsR/SmtB family transcription factor n=1 Tax=Cellvibrio sp. PSBB006 TaxID=1987723 RepID=UPI000B3B1D93|nr:metalloregulator ArsR/SmtB family transcription factor [Cellvibrio sp. PSBB006]ARU27254.1 transcriptional regulator [Cellvibrio sp. PSBB006]